MKPKILISHGSDETMIAARIAEVLERADFIVRKHLHRTEETDRSKNRISAALAGSGHVVAVLSPESVDRAGRIRRDLAEMCSPRETDHARRRRLVLFKAVDCAPVRTDTGDVRIIDAVQDLAAGLVALAAAVLAQPDVVDNDRVDDTSWLFTEDGLEHVRDEIQFFSDGTTRFKNTGTAYHSVVPYPSVSFTVSEGRWSQTGNAVAFTVRNDGAVRCGMVESGILRSVEPPAITAMLLRTTNKQRIGHELAYDGENNRSRERYERDGDVVRRRIR